MSHLPPNSRSSSYTTDQLSTKPDSTTAHERACSSSIWWQSCHHPPVWEHAPWEDQLFSQWTTDRLKPKAFFFFFFTLQIAQAKLADISGLLLENREINLSSTVGEAE